MLNRLKSQGHIKRSRNSADERLGRFTVTEAGRKLQLRASDIVLRVRKVTGLDDRQVENLVTRVDALRQALEAHNSK
jgi:DNA-binding MarR family transcriptional regulator